MTDVTAVSNGGAIGCPLRLRPALDAKTWGGRRLERLGKSLPPGAIGESLESGSDAVIVGGSFDGLTLGALARAAPVALLGPRGLAAAGNLSDFPLLVKFIDARQTLSIQVHPDDRRAPAGKRGKTEAWLIVDADPGAQLVIGARGALDPEQIEQQLVRCDVRPGDVFLVPAGTVHAIGGGVLLYEIQQASDVTYRLHDWGRPRELHVAAALAAAEQDQCAPRVEPLRLDASREMLVACRYFALERWSVAGRTRLPSRPESCRVLTTLEGSIVVDGARFGGGDSAALPADLPDMTLDGDATILVGYIPDLDRDVRQPLRAAGHSDEAIEALGLAFG